MCFYNGGRGGEGGKERGDIRVRCAWRMDACGMREEGRCSHPKETTNTTAHFQRGLLLYFSWCSASDFGEIEDIWNEATTYLPLHDTHFGVRAIL